MKGDGVRAGTSQAGRSSSNLAIRTNLGFKSDEEQQNYIGGLLLSNLSFASDKYTPSGGVRTETPTRSTHSSCNRSKYMDFD